MARFFVGQRVRKVRGLCVGLTGVVVEIDPLDDRSLGVRVDGGGVGLDPFEREAPFQSGAIVFGRPDEHEPILPSGHQPAELTAEELLPFLKTREVA